MFMRDFAMRGLQLPTCAVHIMSIKILRLVYEAVSDIRVSLCTHRVWSEVWYSQILDHRSHDHEVAGMCRDVLGEMPWPVESYEV